MNEKEYLVNSFNLIERKVKRLSLKSYFKIVYDTMNETVTDEDKIKYIDEKIKHLMMQKKKLKGNVLKKASKFTQERFDRTTEDLKRICNGEKISKIAKERGVSASSVADRVNRRTRRIIYREDMEKYCNFNIYQARKYLHSKGIYE